MMAAAFFMSGGKLRGSGLRLDARWASYFAMLALGRELVPRERSFDCALRAPLRRTEVLEGNALFVQAVLLVNARALHSASGGESRAVNLRLRPA